MSRGLYASWEKTYSSIQEGVGGGLYGTVNFAVSETVAPISLIAQTR